MPPEHKLIAADRANGSERDGEKQQEPGRLQMPDRMQRRRPVDPAELGLAFPNNKTDNGDWYENLNDF
ncbi:hypothetical protein D3C73_1215190 [compost metagenome]